MPKCSFHSEGLECLKKSSLLSVFILITVCNDVVLQSMMLTALSCSGHHDGHKSTLFSNDIKTSIDNILT